MLRTAAGAAACLAVLAAALTSPAHSMAFEQPSSGVRVEAAAAGTARHVVAISVDGLNPDALAVLGPRKTPALHRMVAEGVSTMEARTAYELTKTMPNHAGIFTGRRVAGKKGHGVRANVDTGRTVHRAAGRYIPSLFDVVHDRGGSTALFASKDKFALFNRTWGRRGAPDKVGADDGRDKIDRFTYRAQPRKLVDRILARFDARRPWMVTFLHIASPDVAGHDHGFMTRKYLRAVRASDRQIGRILDAVASSPRLSRTVTVVLTSDHGGNEDGHFESHQYGDYRIPFLAWGAGVPAGRDLYDLNPKRVHPGTGRPRYRDAPPIRNTDMASLVTTWLGLPPVPGGLLRKTSPLRLR